MRIKRIITCSGVDTNTYFIEENNSAIIVDPGEGGAKIIDFLKKENVKAEYVLLTHGHFDHAGGAKFLQDLGVKIYISAIDYALLEENDFNIRLGFGCEKVEPFRADVKVSDGDIFSLLGHEFEVIATPGHTPGGVCFFMDGAHLFSGDTMFRMNVGRSDFPFSDVIELKKSLLRLKNIKGDCTVYPGHGEQTMLDFEREHNPYLYYE